MISEPPRATPESGLPGRQGEFAVSLPWIGRLVLTMAVGAALGLLATVAFAPHIGGHAPRWVIVAAGALAATVLSIRRFHSWHVSTFVDGTLAGIAAAPIFAIIASLHTAISAETQLTFATSAWHGFLALIASFVGALITIPCGWCAGFGYHLLISAVERGRADSNDSA